MRYAISLIFVLLITGSCKQKTPELSGQDHKSPDTEIGPSKSEGNYPGNQRNEHMVLGTLFQQKAGEYRALCYQAFNLGKLMLDKDLLDNSVDKHRIIVLDIDETVLDNSPFQAKCILQGTSYPEYWDEWCNRAIAKALPGALDFLLYAKANGVGIYYITNRKVHLKEATLRNLAELGFPDADNDHIIMRTSVDSKESRRQDLLKKNHISLLFGDNLNDFSDAFEKKDPASRAAEVDRMNKLFGQKFIVLPNAMYGDWESALYGFDQKQPDSVKYLIRRNALTGF
ncbi:MAG: 5'-nucleotidase, lipoprotein e(P4) family [Bacteroidales bacterium]|nr:5'-nucleotidase, lipoprotein e(P4) family [Bacteroidales bacterium]MBK9357252.1 5'-nucleotidase, lipoprotein e(P4) family [Bacteroidales bacterium]